MPRFQRNVSIIHVNEIKPFFIRIVSKKNNRRLLCFLTFMENCLAVSFLGG